jgi:hypothetical protein
MAGMKTRWLRFSLRTLLLLITALCIWLGVQVTAARRQKEAVEAILKAGGQVGFDYQMVPATSGGFYEFNIDSSAASAAPAWLHGLVGDDVFRTVVQVHFTNLRRGIAESDLAQLDQLPALRSLQISHTDIACDDGSLRHLRNSDLSHIAGLRQLRTLVIWNSDVDTAGVASMVNLKHLKSLSLKGAPVDDSGLRYLENLPNLEWLDLEGTSITDAGITDLARLTGLKTLRVGLTRITYEGEVKLYYLLPNTTLSPTLNTSILQPRPQLTK